MSSCNRFSEIEKQLACTEKKLDDLNARVDKLFQLQAREPLLSKYVSQGFEWMPHWFAEPRAVNFMVHDWEDGCSALNVLAVPMLPFAFASTAMLWVFFAVFPLAGYKYSQCPSASKPFATLPVLLLMTYLPFLAISIALEVHMLRYVWVAHAETVVAPKFFGRRLSFPMLLLLGLSVSVLSHADLATNSAFMAKALKTWVCNTKQSPQPMQDIDRIWAEYVEQSVFRHVGLNRVSFFALVIVAWFLMSVQLFSTLMATVPMKRRQDHTFFTHDFKVIFDKEQYGENNYQTIFGDTDHDDALMALADCNRMGAITFLDSAYLQNYGESNPHYVLIYMERLVKRFAFFRLLETAIQLQLQTSLFPMSFIAGGGEFVDFQTVFSIGVSIMMAFVSLKAEITKFQVLVKLLIEDIEQWGKEEEDEDEDEQEEEEEEEDQEKAEEDGRGGEGEEEEDVEEGTHTDEDKHVDCLVGSDGSGGSGCLGVSDVMQEQKAKWIKSSRNLSIIFYTLVLLYVYLIMFAIAKFVMAFVCTDAVWNLTGCVSLAGLRG